MPIPTGTHINDELLERYALGYLSEDSVSELDNHLLLCEGCQLRLNEVEEHAQVMSAAAAELRRKPFRSKLKSLSLAWLWSMPKPVWAGAMAAIALTVGISAYHQSEPVTAPHEITLQASRGIDNRLLAPKPGNLILSFDTTELVSLPEYQVQILTAGGEVAWHAKVAGAKGMLHIPVSIPLAAGKYWVRLSGPDATDLLREYGLDIK